MNAIPLSDDQPEISIIDTVSGRFATVLRVVLDHACPRSHVLEMFDIFGKDVFVKFLDIFSGTLIKVPTKDKLEDCMRQVVVFLELKRTPASKRPTATRELAKKYGMTAGEVRTIFVNVGNLFSKEGYILP